MGSKSHNSFRIMNARNLKKEETSSMRFIFLKSQPSSPDPSKIDSNLQPILIRSLRGMRLLTLVNVTNRLCWLKI